MYYRRFADPIGPCTARSKILSGFRFTNTYGQPMGQPVFDIRSPGRDRPFPRAARSLLSNHLFKIFNQIETWEALEQRLGPITLGESHAAALDRALENLRRRGNSIYSAAYIMPSPAFGRERKHSNHIRTSAADDEGSASRPNQASPLHFAQSSYELVLNYPRNRSFPRVPIYNRPELFFASRFRRG